MSAQVRERPGHDASGGHRLDRRVLVMWWTVGALLTAAVVAMTVVAVVAFDVPRAPVAAAPAAVAVAAAAVPPLRYRRWRYDVRARDALVSKGALFCVAKVVPFDR